MGLCGTINIQSTFSSSRPILLYMTFLKKKIFFQLGTEIRYEPIIPINLCSYDIAEMEM
jgi:hypothetical protein